MIHHDSHPKDNTDFEHTNESERKKQNQDFPNIPPASENQSPPDITKEDVSDSSDTADSGKTDNTED
ncbi:hypothetical protein [Planobacterium oryzisoli]|uniref:Uncharacterized protein n=1 Tax=Planobacterium oryzisoli TaxID=2771435 RepID=A0A930YTY3_9FLAO|nr:hypothetical protein [Planobacterium oryzisoli]MBF5026299.1 hypothetical protein [Planobacterium oryzisoli]